MRKRIILLLTIGILAILTLNVYAASTGLQLAGKDKVETGKTETMTLKLVSDSDIVGVVSGQVKRNENIESVQMQGKNGWQVTYNNGTGEFNALKAEGAKTEEIAEITYKVKTEASGKANITVSNIKLTTIEYKTTTASNVSKDVIIGSENTQPTATPTPTQKPTPTPTPDGGSESTPTPSTKPTNTGAPTENPSQNSGVDKGDVSVNNTDKNSSNGGASSSGSQNSSSIKGPTTSTSTLPKAGAEEYLLISTIAVAIASVIFYIKYKKYQKV